MLIIPLGELSCVKVAEVIDTLRLLRVSLLTLFADGVNLIDRCAVFVGLRVCGIVAHGVGFVCGAGRALVDVIIL